MSIDAWAKEVDINPTTLRARINNGWSTEKALTVKPIPPEERRNHTR